MIVVPFVGSCPFFSATFFEHCMNIKYFWCAILCNNSHRVTQLRHSKKSYSKWKINWMYRNGNILFLLLLLYQMRIDRLTVLVQWCSDCMVAHTKSLWRQYSACYKPHILFDHCLWPLIRGWYCNKAILQLNSKFYSAMTSYFAVAICVRGQGHQLFSHL